MQYNGLSTMEAADGRIEHLDPAECILFLPRRHWKRNCVCHIDAETVRLQTIYADGRRKGPLLRSNKGGHFTRIGLYNVVKRAAARTDIPCNELISPLTLKRTFAREWLRSGGTVCSLQKQLGHKHLWSTAHYLRFIMEDVLQDHARLMRRVEVDQEAEPVRLVP
jgi:integrase